MSQHLSTEKFPVVRKKITAAENSVLAETCSQTPGCSLPSATDNRRPNMAEDTQTHPAASGGPPSVSSSIRTPLVPGLGCASGQVDGTCVGADGSTCSWSGGRQPSVSPSVSPTATRERMSTQEKKRGGCCILRVTVIKYPQAQTWKDTAECFHPLVECVSPGWGRRRPAG